jgi:c-di-GMP-binding flagellar brake protein YcgR
MDRLEARMEELSAEAIKTLRKRFQTCQYLVNALDVERQPERSCKDFPCFDACPLQMMERVEVENRKCKRKLVSVSILFGKKMEHTALTRDISVGGMGIQSDQIFAPGTQILIGIPDQGDCFAEAKVVWINKNSVEANMGVQFTRMTGEFKGHLQSILITQR